MPRRVIHEVQMLSVSVDEQMSFILDFLRVNGPSSLLAMTVHMTDKIRIVVTVIALLELTKNKVISLSGTEGADDIMISPARPVAQPLASTA
jgi:chromatin segregation and condensation protein Rec8/ScpA/Scc1 (kleisin family)